MAPPAYTTRLAFISDTGPIDQVAYTVQPNQRVVVRDVVWTIPTVGKVLNLYVRQPGGSVSTILYVAGEDPYSKHLELRQALHVGDQLVVNYNGEDSLFVLVTGYALSEDGT